MRLSSILGSEYTIADKGYDSEELRKIMRQFYSLSIDLIKASCLWHNINYLRKENTNRRVCFKKLCTTF
jgi:hypothetical protein